MLLDPIWPKQCAQRRHKTTIISFIRDLVPVQWLYMMMASTHSSMRNCAIIPPYHAYNIKEVYDNSKHVSFRYKYCHLPTKISVPCATLTLKVKLYFICQNIMSTPLLISPFCIDSMGILYIYSDPPLVNPGDCAIHLQIVGDGRNPLGDQTR